MQCSSGFWDRPRRLAADTKAYAVSRARLADAELQVPPSPVQCAIGAIPRDIDAAIAGPDHRLDQTRGAKQGMMQRLLTGTDRLPASGFPVEEWGR